MKASRYVVFAVAAVAALLLAFVVRGLIGGKPAPEAPAKVVVEVPTTKVLVAARDLKVGQRLTEADLVWKEWPADALNEAYYVDGVVKTPEPAPKPDEEAAPKKNEVKKEVKKAGEAVAEAADAAINPTRGKESLLNAVVREPILQNEPVIDRKVVHAGQAGILAVVLEPGKRAMAVPISVETTAGGFILPGDRVDILVSGSGNGSEGESGPMSRHVLRNIKVLAIDQAATAPEEGSTAVGATATLEVTLDEAQALARARNQGTLALLLRSYADVNEPSGRVAPQVDTHRISVIRNGQVSEVTVER